MIAPLVLYILKGSLHWLGGLATSGKDGGLYDAGKMLYSSQY